jgi:hypothetical protein
MTRKVQEAYNVSKRIAVNRYVDKKVSPQCEVEPEKAKSYYQRIWATPGKEFIEAKEDEPIF